MIRIIVLIFIFTDIQGVVLLFYDITIHLKRFDTAYGYHVGKTAGSFDVIHKLIQIWFLRKSRNAGQPSQARASQSENMGLFNTFSNYTEPPQYIHKSSITKIPKFSENYQPPHYYPQSTDN